MNWRLWRRFKRQKVNFLRLNVFDEDGNRIILEAEDFHLLDYDYSRKLDRWAADLYRDASEGIPHAQIRAVLKTKLLLNPGKTRFQFNKDARKKKE